MKVVFHRDYHNTIQRIDSNQNDTLSFKSELYVMKDYSKQKEQLGTRQNGSQKPNL